MLARLEQPGDHPRIRGEHRHFCTRRRRCDGSSPHTRGARKRRGPVRRRRGIIPAYAGSTSPTDTLSRRPQDHPRIRGEHKLQARRVVLDQGSSPHTRGARQVRTRSPTTWSDHPRIRGEHAPASFGSEGWGGSSPHTRGAHSWSGPGRLTQRIIPAYAGSTGRIRCLSIVLWRIIPAYAGSTRRRGGRVRRVRDHPRIRGEHGPSR